jgi:hypothetical protein
LFLACEEIALEDFGALTQTSFSDLTFGEILTCFHDVLGALVA